MARELCFYFLISEIHFYVVRESQVTFWAGTTAGNCMKIGGRGSKEKLEKALLKHECIISHNSSSRDHAGNDAQNVQN